MKRNARRYGYVVLTVALLASMYFGPVGGLILAAMFIPALILSVGLVELLPPLDRGLVWRLTTVAVSTAVGYVSLALIQTARIGDSPAPVDPWSPTYAMTFLGLVGGFAFGLIAVPKRGVAPATGSLPVDEPRS